MDEEELWAGWPFAFLSFEVPLPETSNLETLFPLGVGENKRIRNLLCKTFYVNDKAAVSNMSNHPLVFGISHSLAPNVPRCSRQILRLCPRSGPHLSSNNREARAAWQIKDDGNPQQQIESRKLQRKLSYSELFRDEFFFCVDLRKKLGFDQSIMISEF